MALKYLNHPLFFLFISTLVGVFSYQHTQNIFSYLMGFCTFITLTCIKVQFTLEKTNNFYNQLIQIFKSVELNDNFSELSLFLQLKKIGKFKNADIHVNKDKIHSFWYEYVSRVQNRLEALTYVDPKDSWELGWNKVAIGVQQDRIAHKCKITRIFIIDKKEDLVMYKSVFYEQHQIGIEVKWVLKETLLSNKFIRTYAKEIQTLDFGIVDNSWVVRVLLTSHRKLDKTIASKNKKILDKSRKIFDEAYHLSIPFNITTP